ncbi:type IV toxin-antitoxin system AbiEi family antitoxin [Xylanibacter rodentium]|uniref:type IV toxin-antitoxin system AbiEi family antitoxin n=1 Tax=Xylanibacter rodentium TaxID=2736289 RepID=UPI001A2B25F5|nr:type IV toxin-antitoxin system AbiEi family antitoxin [Xylanibacter rodentium]MBJ2195475.1 type IV toxin-antitoxin system AbiEi family antitoxin [Muribaculaceae bacterium]
MSIATASKLNHILSESLPGGLLFAGWLRKKGYSSQLLKKYRDSGWLEGLVRGVMYRRNDNLSAMTAVYCYNHQTGNSARVAAHSALELLGFSHYVPMGKPRLMVAFESVNVEDWVKSDRYDMTIVPFHTGIFKEPLTQSYKGNHYTLKISSPEQAFLECLYLVPDHYNYMDLYYIMEQLTSLDPEKVQAALVGTSSQRIKRMFLYMAEKAGHYWFDMLDMDKFGLTSSKLKLVDSGIYNSKYRITVPKELNDYE